MLDGRHVGFRPGRRQSRDTDAPRRSRQQGQQLRQLCLGMGRQGLRQCINAFEQTLKGELPDGPRRGQAAVQQGIAQRGEYGARGVRQAAVTQARLHQCCRAPRQHKHYRRCGAEFQQASSLHGLTIARTLHQPVERAA